MCRAYSILNIYVKVIDDKSDRVITETFLNLVLPNYLENVSEDVRGCLEAGRMKNKIRDLEQYCKDILKGD